MVGPQPDALGPLLRGFRHVAGMTLEELAEASGVSDRAIGDMERGHSRGPQARTVQALAAALGLPQEDADTLLAAARAGRRRTHRTTPGLCDLPPAIPDFAGRDEEIRWLDTAGGPGAGPHAVIVTGAPGLGKTTLVVQAAHRQANRYGDGCLFLNLRGLDPEPLHPHDALARLLKALGVRERDLPADPEERQVLHRHLVRDKNVLVILDNAADEAQLRPLLPGEGTCTFWITSRRALTGIEYARRLVPPPLPADAATALLETITADRTGPGTDESEPASLRRVADLCGGLPLALRIAGNRLVSRPAWTATSLADRLAAEDLRLDRLTAGDLRIKSAFTLSYEQLTNEARQLFRRLSLVRGPDFSPALAAALTSFQPGDVERITDELIELGLLNAGSDDRASFHDLVRLYAHQRLNDEESPEEREAALAALDTWLLDTACTAGQWFEPGGSQWVADRSLVDLRDAASAERWLRTESAHWFAALRAAAAAGAHRRVVDVAESMHWFSDRWSQWGHWHTVFALSRAAAHALGDPGLEATHTNYLAWAVNNCLGRPADGMALALEAAELARQAQDPVQEAWSLTYAAYAATDSGQFGSAVDQARRAVALFAGAGDKEGHPQALLGLALNLRAAGRLQEAADTFDVAVARVSAAETAPAPHIADVTAMNALAGKAQVLLDLERWEAANEACDRALERDARVGVPLNRGVPAMRKAQALWALDRRTEALDMIEDAVRCFTEARSERWLDEATGVRKRFLDRGPTTP
ncbi:helix-turn-helix domain-containing protein [Streptomyces cellulosae]|uniref:helix-turn-helix domain-containing protein n=1 Tax=Streptomyces cellulosae TaxID=1968 RepID=UPI0006923AE2|nr:helix-turn-helix domain-containing protein [Streptomyces cellulosae]